MTLEKSKLNPAIAFESIDYIYKNAWKNITILGISGIIFLIFSWNAFEPYLLIFTLFVFSALAFAWHTLLSAYNKDLTASTEVEKWKKKLFYFSAGFGVMWGVFAFLYYSDSDPNIQVAYFLLLIGVILGSASVYEYYEPLFRLTIIPIYFGVIFHLIQNISIFTFLIALAWTLFSLYMSYSVKKQSQLHQRFFDSEYQNSLLLKRLEKQKKQTLKKTQEKAYFIASANHDIRQPVHALNLMMDALQRQSLSEQNNAIVQSMKTSLSVLKNYLMSMLDMARIDAKTIEVELSPVNLKALLAEIQINFNDLAQEHNVTFKTKATNTSVNLDRDIVNMVLTHLLHNAFKFSADKKVLVTAKVVNGYVRFQVMDNGKGIKLIDQKTIFDDFKQLDENESFNKQGLGLGLSISQKLLKLVSATIQVQSTLGKGSCFSVFFPLDQHNVQDLPALAKTSISQKSIKNKHILVIDDDKMVLDAMFCILSSWDCEVSKAVNYLSAIEVLNNDMPDMIISDYRLEGDNGVEVINQLNSHWGTTVPALIVTGDTSPEKLKLFKQYSISVFYKPLQADQLKVSLESLIQ